MKKIRKFINDFIEDILIFLGILVLIITTFSLDTYLGFYLLGVILIVLGIYFAKHPFKRG